MHEDNTLCDRKPQTGSSGLSGSGLIDPIEPLKYPIPQFIGDTNTGIGDLYIKEFMIGIQRDPDPSVFFIIFDRILYEIVKGKREFHFVYIRHYLTHALKDQLNVPFSGDRAESFQNKLHLSIDIYLCDIKLRGGLIHTDEG